MKKTNLGVKEKVGLDFTKSKDLAKAINMLIDELLKTGYQCFGTYEDICPHPPKCKISRECKKLTKYIGNGSD